jgi:hypothetical protein
MSCSVGTYDGRGLVIEKITGCVFFTDKEEWNLFSDNYKLSENSDYKSLSGKELTNSLPDKS